MFKNKKLIHLIVLAAIFNIGAFGFYELGKIGTKLVTITGVANNKIPKYDSATGKFTMQNDVGISESRGMIINSPTVDGDGAFPISFPYTVTLTRVDFVCVLDTSGTASTWTGHLVVYDSTGNNILYVIDSTNVVSDSTAIFDTAFNSAILGAYMKLGVRTDSTTGSPVREEIIAYFTRTQ